MQMDNRRLSVSLWSAHRNDPLQKPGGLCSKAGLALRQSANISGRVRFIQHIFNCSGVMSRRLN